MKRLIICVLLLVISSLSAFTPDPSGLPGPPGPQGATGPSGFQGPQGPQGVEGPAAETVHFSMATEVAPPYEFAFCQVGTNTPAPFDLSTTNPSPLNFPSSFLVPFHGTISNLTVRVDFTVQEHISPNFLFTVYESQSAIGKPKPLASWSATDLAQETGPLTNRAHSSMTATFQNLSDTVAVKPGSILTVVVTPTFYEMGEIKPAVFSASFKYTPYP